jgi:hypothetical protein
MKTIFNIAGTVVCLVLTGLGVAVAEPAGEVGYLRLVNAIARGSGRLGVRVDGAEIYPKGYQPGAVTGGIGLATGNHKLEVRSEGVRVGRGDVKILKNHTVTVVVHAEEIPEGADRPARFAARLLPLALPQVENGKVATLVSVSRKPLLRVEVRGIDGKWMPVEVMRLGTAETPLVLGRGYVALRSGGRALDAIPVAEAGNYGVVLFDDAKGRLCSVSFRDCGELAGD